MASGLVGRNYCWIASWGYSGDAGWSTDQGTTDQRQAAAKFLGSGVAGQGYGGFGDAGVRWRDNRVGMGGQVGPGGLVVGDAEAWGIPFRQWAQLAYGILNSLLAACPRPIRHPMTSKTFYSHFSCKGTKTPDSSGEIDNPRQKL